MGRALDKDLMQNFRGEEKGKFKMRKDAKIYIAGHNGMAGSAIRRELEKKGYDNLVVRTHQELDLCRQSEVESFFEKERPEYVFLAAAKVGGISANINYPAEFLYYNLMIESNVINTSYKYGVKKLVFLGSSCIYPRNCPQPMKEEYLLDGKVEPTNEGYAIAKIAGVKLCEMYNRQYGMNCISLMPCNLFGYNDCFDTEKAHVIPALLMKFHEAKVKQAKEVVVWGSGRARREFLFSDDFAQACIYMFENYEGQDIINIGSGNDVSIGELASIISRIVGYEGNIIFDCSKPDGMPQKLMNVTVANELGWKNHNSLEKGLYLTYRWFLKNYGS